MVAGLAALFVLVEAVVPVLIVDAACFRGGEGVVGFCYFDEFVMGGVVAPGRWGVLAQSANNCPD